MTIKSFSVKLEVCTKDHPFLTHRIGKEYSAYPRSVETLRKAVSKMVDFVSKNKDIFIDDFRITVYEGRKEWYHKDRAKDIIIQVHEKVADLI
jgi:hypothetical protein